MASVISMVVQDLHNVLGTGLYLGRKLCFAASLYRTPEVSSLDARQEQQNGR